MSPNGQKPPAFLFYAADFLTDTMAWSAEEVGAYLRLLCHAWINRSVPDDLRRMAAICGVESESFERLWHEVLSSKFHKTTYGLVNPRMEKERAALGSRKERAEKAAAQRWQKTSNGVSKGEASPEHMLDGCSSDAKPMPNGCLSSSSSSSSSKSTPQPPKGGSRQSTKRRKPSLDVAYSSPFLSWYRAYPRREHKADAWKAWNQLLDAKLALPANRGKERGSAEERISERLCGLVSAKVEAGDWRPDSDDRRFIPLPASWLRGDPL